MNGYGYRESRVDNTIMNNVLDKYNTIGLAEWMDNTNGFNV